MYIHIGEGVGVYRKPPSQAPNSTAAVWLKYLRILTYIVVLDLRDGADCYSIVKRTPRISGLIPPTPTETIYLEDIDTAANLLWGVMDR